jgi:hypothetical protein
MRQWADKIFSRQVETFLIFLYSPGNASERTLAGPYQHALHEEELAKRATIAYFNDQMTVIL